MTLIPKYLKDFPEATLPVEDGNVLPISPATEGDPDSYRITAPELANYVGSKIVPKTAEPVIMTTGLLANELPSHQYIPLIFDVVTYDPESAFNRLTGEYTASTDAFYRFDLHITATTQSLDPGDHLYFILYSPPFNPWTVDMRGIHAHTYPAVMLEGVHTFDYTLIIRMLPDAPDNVVGLALYNQAHVTTIKVSLQYLPILTITRLPHTLSSVGNAAERSK